jgi:hypothetical protein
VGLSARWEDLVMYYNVPYSSFSVHNKAQV